MTDAELKIEDGETSDQHMWLTLYDAYMADIESGKLDETDLAYAKERCRVYRRHLARHIGLPYVFVEEAAAERRKRGRL